MREVHFGVEVPDPYRALEDLHAPETRAWMDAENQLTATLLSRIPGRDALRARLAAAATVPFVSPPIVHAGRYFWTESDGRQPQRVLLMAQSLAETPTVVFDPNLLSRDGSLAFTRIAVNDRGTTVAYGLAAGGGDWQRWRVRDVARGKDLGEVLDHVKYSRLDPGKGRHLRRVAKPQFAWSMNARSFGGTCRRSRPTPSVAAPSTVEKSCAMRGPETASSSRRPSSMSVQGAISPRVRRTLRQVCPGGRWAAR